MESKYLKLILQI